MTLFVVLLSTTCASFFILCSFLRSFHRKAPQKEIRIKTQQHNNFFVLLSSHFTRSLLALFFARLLRVITIDDQVIKEII
jgi:hypothetical protein